MVTGSSYEGVLALAACALLAACDAGQTPPQVTPDAGAAAPTLGPWWLEDSCAQQACEVSSSQRGARLSLTVDLCGAAPLVIDLGSNDEAQSFLRDGDSCQLEDRQDGAFGRWSCGDCQVVLHEVEPQEALRVDSVALDARPPYLPSNHLREPLDHLDPLSGWLSDMVVLDDGRVLVASHEDGAENLIMCSALGPSTLQWVDPESLAVVQTATAPPCLTRLGRDGAGGFFGVVGGIEPKIAHFSAFGALLEVSEIGLPTTSSPVAATRMVVTPDEVHLVLASRVDPIVSLVGTWDRATRSSLGWVQLDRTMLRGAVWDDDRLLSVDRVTGDLYALQPELQTAAPLASLFDVWRRSDDGGELLLAAPERLVISATGQRGALHVVLRNGGGFELGSVATFFERPAAPWALTPWSKAPDQVMVGLTENGAEAGAWLARFDLRSSRYRPGAVHLGYGVVSRLEATPDGTLWALLPWQGRLVRVR